MKYLLNLFFVLVFFVLNYTLEAQDTLVFKEGLVVSKIHFYTRNSLTTDHLAYKLYKGTIETPKEGQTFSTFSEDSVKHTWRTIKADEEGLFKGKEFYGGYLYLTYQSEEEKVALLNIRGNSMVFFNSEPHAGSIYGDQWFDIPVKVKKGTNEIFVRTNYFSVYGLSARLIFTKDPIQLKTDDLTLPDIVLSKDNSELWGAIVITNLTEKTLNNLELKSIINTVSTKTKIPSIPPMTTRKVGFRFNASGINETGQHGCQLELVNNNELIDNEDIILNVVQKTDRYKSTFISNIDGSVQYYAVCPPNKDDANPTSLFLSLHGAGVEAIGQARAYQPKDWGTLVAPTNRRPRGFNWEEWGCKDAFEVLEIAKKEFNPDPERIYLTGHSMGGHGTWFVGATFPDKWAAIAPCAAYPTLMVYGSADGKIPQKGENETLNTLLRASNGSNVIDLVNNFTHEGIYIHHGDSDKVVSVNYARQMRNLLGDFHADFSYYEYPGGSHWFSNQSVDWPPLFDYFKWHTRKPDSVVNNIDFTTANPAVSSSYYWTKVLQQIEPLEYSHINLLRDRSQKTITGNTENISVLGLKLNGFNHGDTVFIIINSQKLNIVVEESTQEVYLSLKDQLSLCDKPGANQKGIIRNGTFKEPFNNRMVFVYGTKGNKDENQWSYSKARFDAETWYYRGNGAVDIVADKDFLPAKYADRGVVLYGNSTTNSAWKKLLSDCPIKVSAGELIIGTEKYKGNDLGIYFTWPRFDSQIASVAVVSGTGLTGMNAANANQYFAAGSGYPDYLIFSADMLINGIDGIKKAGFYTNLWEIAE